MPLTPEDIDAYFSHRNNNFTNQHGMHFIRNEHGIFSYVVHPDSLSDEEIGEYSYQMGIETKGDTAAEFIMLFRLENSLDIDHLSYNSSWMRYLNSYAEMFVTVLSLDINVHFLLHHQKTMIFNPELHFYDEINTHLTLPEDFEKYLKKNRWKLQEALNRRNRFSQ